MRLLIFLLCFFFFALPARCETARPAGETTITLTFGGDCVLGTREEWDKTPETFDGVIDEKGYAWPFSGLEGIFKADDMSLVNLECVLQSDFTGHDYKKQHCFRGLPDYALLLQEAGIEQVNIANNHIVDYRLSGQASTKAALEAAGVSYSGMGERAVYEKEGIRIGFAGCRETAWREDRTVIEKDIAFLLDAGCDAIIYSCHFGREYSPKHNQTQEEMARAALDAGATVIVGTHPHCVQGIARESGKLIIYSLGNLVFGGTLDMRTFDALIARVTLRFDAAGYRGAELTLIPVLTSGAIPQNDFRPVLAEGADKARIMNLIQADTDFPIEETMWFAAD